MNGGFTEEPFGPDTSDQESRDDGNGRISEPVIFLEKLRPGGPWVLTAIVPDGPTKTITTGTAEEVDAFVSMHDGKRNLYYAVNPTRTAMSIGMH